MSYSIEKFFIKKVVSKLVKEGKKYLPSLFSEAQNFINSEKEKVVWEDNEVHSLFPVIDYDRKKFFIYIFRLEPPEKIVVSRVYFQRDLKDYFSMASNIDFDSDKITNLITDKVNLLLDEKTETNPETIKEKNNNTKQNKEGT